MNRSQMIRLTIYDILEDYQPHSTAEFRAVCMERGIVDESNADQIRFVLRDMMKRDETIMKVDRGVYVQMTDDIVFEGSVLAIEMEITRLANLNWLALDDIEKDRERKHIERLRELAEDILEFVEAMD